MSRDFTEDIQVLHANTSHHMRAMLDTGIEVHAIHLVKVQNFGLPILEYTRPPLSGVGGTECIAVPKVERQFYFKSYRPARTLGNGICGAE